MGGKVIQKISLAVCAGTAEVVLCLDLFQTWTSASCASSLSKKCVSLSRLTVSLLWGYKDRAVSRDTNVGEPGYPAKVSETLDWTVLIREWEQQELCILCDLWCWASGLLLLNSVWPFGRRLSIPCLLQGIAISQGNMKVWVIGAVDRKDRLGFGCLNLMYILVSAINPRVSNVFLQEDDIETSRILRVLLALQQNRLPFGRYLYPFAVFLQALAVSADGVYQDCWEPWNAQTNATSFWNWRRKF